MNEILKDINKQLNEAFTGYSHIYYFNLPNLEIVSSDNAITYTLSLVDVEDTMDAKEAITIQELAIKHIAKKGARPMQVFLDDSIYKLKAAIYKLKTINSRVVNVSFNSNILEYDDELETYSMLLNFDLTITE